MEEELERLRRALEDFEDGIPEPTLFDRFKRALEDTRDEQTKFTVNLKTAGAQVKKAGSEFKTAAGDIRKAREEFDGLSSAVSGVSSLLSGLGSAVMLLGPAGLAAGVALKGTAMVFDEAGQLLIDVTQETAKNYKVIGSVGAIGAAGMMEFRLSAQAAGLTMEQFARLVRDNSRGLAFATGNTVEGARAMSILTKEIGDTGLRNQFRALGIGLEEQTVRTADFLEVNTLLTGRQTRDYASQARAASNYVFQLDELARITGMTRDEAQKALEQQRGDARFLSAQRRAVARFGPEIGKQISFDMEKAMLIIQELGDPALAKSVRDLFGGPGTKAGQAAMAALGSEAMVAADRLQTNQISVEEFLQVISRGSAQFQDRFGELLPVIAGRDTIFEPLIIGTARFAAVQDKSIAEIEATIKEQREARDARNKETRSVVEALDSIQGIATSLDSLRTTIFEKGIPAVTGFADVLNSGAQAIAQALGTGAPAIQTRAVGGPVSAGDPYLVGEAGPELMIPQVAGEVFTNKNTNAILQQYQNNIDVVTQGIKMFETAFANQNVLNQRPGPIETRGTSFFVRGDNTIEGYQLGGVHGSTFLDAAGNVVKHVLPFFVEGLQSTLFADNTRSVKYQAGPVSLEGILNQQNELLKTITSYTIGDNKTQVVKDLVNRLETTSTKGYSERPAYDPLIDNFTSTRSFDNGGIASGPKSGYQALLHGTEAVVPLPDGNSIPVNSDPKLLSTLESLSKQLQTNQNAGVLQALETMNATLQQVASNTKSGSDNTKQLIRATVS